MVIRVGLVGAGPWALRVHAPGLAASSRTELAGTWARRPAAARAVAAAYGGCAYDTVEDLVADVDAVAFAVPPQVQAGIAQAAAEAGRHLVLEKPLAADLGAAQRVAESAERSGVVTGVFFTTRYTSAGRRFVREARAKGGWHGGDAAWVSGGLLGGPFADSPWRHERGALWDIGPHAIELLDAALGPVEAVCGAVRGPSDLVQLTLRHEGGAVSHATLTMRVPTDVERWGVALYGASGRLAFAPGDETPGQAYAALLDQVADRIEGRGDGPECDVRRALAVQQVLHQAAQLVAA